MTYNISSEAHGTILLSLFPWKTIYQLLAEHKLFMRNYPLHTLIPVEIQDANRQPKGIANLWGPEIQWLATALGLCGTTSYPLTICKATSNEHKSKLSFILSQPRLIDIPIEIHEGRFPILSTRPVNSSSSNPRMCHVYYQGKGEDPKIVWVGDEADVEEKDGESLKGDREVIEDEEE